MVTELQFVAVAAFLIWGLVSSLCGVLTAAPDTARLVGHHRGVRPETSDVAPDQRTVASADPSLETHAK
jgi:hypothetical protein